MVGGAESIRSAALFTLWGKQLSTKLKKKKKAGQRLSDRLIVNILTNISRVSHCSGDLQGESWLAADPVWVHGSDRRDVLTSAPPTPPICVAWALKRDREHVFHGVHRLDVDNTRN